RTLRAMGPSEPTSEGQPPYTPLRLTSPAVGRIPTRLFQVDGRRMEASPSWPTATVAKLALMLAPGPPDDPPTVRSRSYGLRVTPNREPKVSPAANSARVALPRMIAPAAFSFSTTKASRVGT